MDPIVTQVFAGPAVVVAPKQARGFPRLVYPPVMVEVSMVALLGQVVP
jgi:hypothetical protein